MVFTRRKDNEPNGGSKKEKKQKVKISRKIEDKDCLNPRELVESRTRAAERMAIYRQRLKSPEDAAEHMLRVMERKNIKKMNATLRMSEWRKGLTDEKKAEINAREAQRKRESRKALSLEQKALESKKKAEYRQRKRQEEEGDPAEKAKSVIRRAANGK